MIAGLTNVLDQIRRDEATYWDRQTEIRHLGMRVDDKGQLYFRNQNLRRSGAPALPGLINMDAPETPYNARPPEELAWLPLSMHAEAQLLQRATDPRGEEANGVAGRAIPQGFFRRCSPKLKREILIEWKTRAGDHVVVPRMAKGEVRAIVTPTYTTVPSSEFVTKVGEALERHTDQAYRVKLSNLHPVSGVHLRLCAEEDFADGLQIGVNIRNADTGFCSIRVSAMVFVVICTNGLIDVVDSAGGRKVHRGAVDYSSMVESVIEVLPEVQDKVRSAQKLTHIDAWGTDDKVVSAIQSRGGTKTLGKNVVALLQDPPARSGIVGVTRSAWNVSQAITYLSQRESVPAKRDELDTLAGRLLSNVRPGLLAA